MRKLIPFAMMPGSWGLDGTTRLIAEAEYYLEGEELELRLVNITEHDPIQRAYLQNDIKLKYERITPYQYDTANATLGFTDEVKLARALLGVEHRHGKIDSYTYDQKLTTLDHPDDVTRKIALLGVERKHNKLDERRYNLERATLLEEPYVAIVKSEYDARLGMNGLIFEFDWNELWIDYLRLNGYTGLTDELLVEQWFADICRSVADEIPEDLPENVPFNSGRVTNRVRRDGTSEYS